MKQDFKDKLYTNALIGERLNKLTSGERQKVIKELLKDRSEQELSNETGIPKSTLHDWKTLRQNNAGEHVHISLYTIKKKLEGYTPKDNQDWVLLHEIQNVVTTKILAKEEVEA